MKRIILTDHFKQQMDPDFFVELSEHEIVTAYSNEEVLKLHRAQRADLIITELYGSGMNGAQLCSLLRQEAGMREVSVILFCRDNEVEREECGRSKANAALTYPVRRNLLRETLERFLHVPPRSVFKRAFNARRSGAPAGAVIDCRTENISVTGMLIEANADLRRGEKLHCTLTLPSSPPYAMLAEVVRTEQERTGTGRAYYGVRFANLNPGARRAIEQMVAHRTPQAS